VQVPAAVEVGVGTSTPPASAGADGGPDLDSLRALTAGTVVHRCRTCGADKPDADAVCPKCRTAGRPRSTSGAIKSTVGGPDLGSPGKPASIDPARAAMVVGACVVLVVAGIIAYMKIFRGPEIEVVSDRETDQASKAAVRQARGGGASDAAAEDSRAGCVGSARRLPSQMRSLFISPELFEELRRARSDLRADIDSDGEFRAVRERLTDARPIVRFAAADACRLLAEEFGPRAARIIPSLTLTLKDDDLPVQSMAAQALAALGSQAVPSLLKALADPDRRSRVGAAAALDLMERSGERAEEELRAALKDSDALVRVMAAGALVSVRGAAPDVVSEVMPVITKRCVRIRTRSCGLKLPNILRRYPAIQPRACRRCSTVSRTSTRRCGSPCAKAWRDWGRAPGRPATLCWGCFPTRTPTRVPTPSTQQRPSTRRTRRCSPRRRRC
jgi:hypothetical protein